MVNKSRIPETSLTAPLSYKALRKIPQRNKVKTFSVMSRKEQGEVVCFGATVYEKTNLNTRQSSINAKVYVSDTFIKIIPGVIM